MFLPYFKRAVLLSFVIFGVNLVHAAQNSSTAGKMQADPALESYMSKRGTPAGRNALDKIGSRDIEITAANINLVREALVTKSSAEERANLVTILGTLYDHRSDRAGMNAGIRNDLKKLVYSTEDSTARAAVFAISRIGGETELVDLLRYAKKNELIDDDEFAGELAHNIRFAPPSRQAVLIALLDESKNQYGMEVLTSTFNHPAVVRKLPHESLARIAFLLEKNEPSFSFSIGEFGAFDAFHYANWLHATALVRESLGKGAYADFVFSQLNNPGTDPRKIMGYLTSNEGAGFLGRTPRAKIDPALQRVRSFADSFPLNPIIQDFATAVFANASRMSK